MVAIHAAKRPAERWTCDREPIHSVLMGHGVAQDDLPVGCVLAVGELVDCQPTTNTAWKWFPLPGSWDAALGDFGPGRWMWQFRGVRCLREPIPCRGQQGLWTVPPDIEVEIVRRLG